MMEGASNPPESFYMFLGPYGQKTAHYWRILSREVLKSRADACVHVLAVGLFHREASVKKNMFVALLLALATAGTAAAQPAAFNDIGVTMGHWHIASKDVEANKKLFLSHGRQAVHARRKPVDYVPRSLHQFGPRKRERGGGHRGFSREPRRFHRQQRPGTGGPVEGRG